MVRPLTPGKFKVVACRGCAVDLRVYVTKPQTFCSIICRSAHLRAGQSCATCGGAIGAPKSHRRKYCSFKCRSEGSRLASGRGLRNEAVATYKRHAKIRGLDWHLTDEQLDALFAGDCHWCGAAPSNRRFRERAFGDFVYNGIDRVNNDLSYVATNCVSCCFTCNSMKRDFTVDLFLEKARRIAARWPL